MRKIIIPPEDCWDYACDHVEDLESKMVEIARNDAVGVSIYLTVDEEEFPVYVVCQDSEEVYEEYTVNATDCEKTGNKLIDKYIEGVSASSTEEPEPEEEDIEEVIKEREDELTDAVLDFLSATCEDSYGLLEGEVEEIKDHFLEFLAREYGLRIYRPMEMETESGEEFLAEYPYDAWVEG